jgi:hypothetical protein
VDIMIDNWPQARLGSAGRLRALAAAFPGAAVTERVIPASFDQVWDYFADMERSVPSFDETVREFRVVARQGTRLVARVKGPLLPLRYTLDVDLDRGWCLMTARPAWYIVAFAAEPSGSQTLFAHAEACNIAGPPDVRRAGAPLLSATRKWLVGHVSRDIDGIERAMGLREDRQR